MALTDNLISWWDLEESSGTRSDEHGSNDLTENNGVGNVSGKVGNAALLDADNSDSLTKAIGTGTSELDLSGTSWTIAAWVYFPTAVAEAYINIITVGTSTQLAKFGTWPWSSATRWEGRVYNDSGGDARARFTSGGIISADTWYFGVLTFDTSTGDLIFNIDNGSETVSATMSGTQRTPVGDYRVGGDEEYFYIDSMAVWSRVLSSSEISELYNSGNGVNYSDISGGGTTGSIDQSVPAFTQSASGTQTNEGTGDQTIPAFTQSASGTQTNEAAIAQSMPAFTQDASGTQTNTGTAAQSIPAFTQSASGTTTDTRTGTIDQTIPAFTQSAAGIQVNEGILTQTLPAFTQSGAGTQTNEGSATQTVPMFTQTVTGVVGARVLKSIIELQGSFIQQQDLEGSFILQEDLDGSFIQTVSLEGEIDD